jgi:beta-N-acetylhexosaminidase
MMLTGEGGGILKQVDAVTTQGVAHAAFGLDKPGLLEIRAASDPAVISEVLQLDVSQAGPVAITVVVPELTQSTEVTPQPAAQPEEQGYVTISGFPRFSAWVIAMLFIGLCMGLGYFTGLRLANPRSGIRWALGIMLGGLIAYNYLAFGVFGISHWLSGSGLPGLLLIVLMGEIFGFAGGWFWSKR